jgi:tartrate dehydrogenase/decarboxylase/D-malate dehydrogenase
VKTHRIALYPGDGIGVEVIREAVRVLEAVQAQEARFELKVTPFDWGSSYHARTGTVAPADFLEILRPFDAIFLGALGDPARIPDHITLAPLIRIRQSFDQYACVRPARLFRGVRSPLANPAAAHTDLVVVRENSEGEYVDSGGRFKAGRPEEFALQTAIHTRRGIERILRFGFEMARTRRRKLTMITKSNAQKYGYVLWDEIFDQVRPGYSDVEASKEHVDAASMNFVRRPELYDVVVGSNLFGDILSDLGGYIAGGLGLAPSANLNPERAHPSLFEPVHGSAPDIAGRGIANPVAAILAAALMLDWLGERSAGDRIRRSVEETLFRGHATADLGGTLKTTQMTDRILEALKGA